MKCFKLILTGLIILSIIQTISVYGSEKSWWNTDWEKKRICTISELSGNDLRDYPVNITMNTALEISEGDMNSDCSDLRVINETSMKELEFSILYPNSENTVITTKLNLTAGSVVDDVYVYYRNSDASAVNISFNDAFYEFWDDFERIDIWDKWGSDNGVDPGYSVSSGGNLKQVAESGQWHWVNVWTLKDFEYTQGWQIDFDFYNTNGNAYGKIVFGDKNNVGREFNTDPESFRSIMRSNTQFYGSYDQYFTTHNSGGGHIHHHSWNLGPGWHNQRIIYDYYNGEFKHWVDGTCLGTPSTANVLSGNIRDWKFGHVLQGGNTGIQPVLDNVKIRAWVDTEPITQLGYEERAQPSLEWTKYYGGSGGDNGYSVQQTCDGGYIIAGYTDSYGEGGLDFYLVKANSNGDMLWNKTYGGPGMDFGMSVHLTTDGGYIVSGFTDSFGAGSRDVYLVKTDSNGDLLWNKTYGGINIDVGRFVDETSDGCYIIAGYTYSFGEGDRDFYLVKTDSNGDMLWNKTYGGPDRDFATSVQETTDGGYIITGLTKSYGAGGDDVYLIKTDSDGNMTWNNTYGGSDYDGGYSVSQTADGGYIITGETRSFSSGNRDLYQTEDT
jgi:hypothetical protein